MTKATDEMDTLLKFVSRQRPRAVVTDSGVFVMNRSGDVAVRVYLDEVELLIADLRVAVNEVRARTMRQLKEECDASVSGKDTTDLSGG